MRKLLVMVAVLSIAAGALALEGKTVKLNGYVIDNACAAGRATGDNPAEKVKAHSVKCAQMAKCADSGYAVFADGKLYKLDAGGNKKVADILKNTKVGKGVAVDVEGTVEGDTLTVKKISEAPAAK